MESIILIIVLISIAFLDKFIDNSFGNNF